MSMNPEFRRNLWLEVTKPRLVGMPAVLGAVLFLAYLMPGARPLDTMVGASLALFGVIVMLWGTRLASESVVSEVRDRTWDSQRMSSIGPWAMTWGKLFGSTAYTWYGGILCLAAYLVLAIGDAKDRPLITMALFASAGLYGQATAILVSMQAIRKERRYDRSMASAFFVVGIAVSWIVISLSVSASYPVTWFGMDFSNKDFVLLTVLAFLGWTVWGIYRLMRAELQMHNGPFVWLAFTCFIAFYFSGFVSDPEPAIRINTGFAVAFIVTLFLTYAMALSERKDPVAYRRLIILYERRDWARLAHGLPCWTVTLLPVFAAAFGMFLTALPNTPLTWTATGYRFFIVASFLFLLRDLGLLLYLNFTKSPKRADMFFVLALAMLYGVIPGIMKGLDLDLLAALFWPMWDQYSSTALPAAAVEALLVMTLLVKRWKGLYADA